MNATPSPATDAGAAAPPPALLAAWPRTAQWALGLLLTLAVLLIILHVTIGGLSDARPTQLEELRSPINLNTADRATLRQLPEVGDALATRIDEYRQRHGGFRSVDELVNVHGIGSTRLARLRQWLFVDDEEPGEEPVVKPASLPTKKQTAAGSPRASRKAEKLKGPVDLNEATEDQLKNDVPWLGPVLARSIVESRRKEPFRSVDDLLRVPGIKQKTLDKVRPFVRVGSKGSV
jgi:DNA uptake protein ComE-like DNA-binding protein